MKLSVLLVVLNAISVSISKVVKNTPMCHDDATIVLYFALHTSKQMIFADGAHSLFKTT